MTERTSVTLSMSCDVSAHEYGLPRIWHYADTDLDAARLRADCDGWIRVAISDENGGRMGHACPHCAKDIM